MWCPALMTNPSPRFDRADWLRLLFYLIGGCGFAFALFWVALNTFLEPKLVSETALRTSRSVALVELALQVIPPEKLPPGVIVKRSWHGPEGKVKLLDSFDRKVQLLMQSRYQVTRQMQRDQRPFEDSWGGMWVRLETFHNPPIWLYQPERLSTSSVWFLPLLRSAALLMGLAIGTILFLKRCVETPFNKVFLKLPDDLPAPLPLLPEQGISPLRVLSLRINRLLERLNNVAAERRAFLRGIVHDLAGPQTRIGLHLELMADSLADAHQDALKAMTSDLQQLKGISQQLALLAERDQPVVSVQQLALDDLCTRLATSYGGQSIRCKVPRLLVRLDASGLERSLCNLIDNALDHGQPPVEIDAWTKKATLVLQVKDEGRAPSQANLLTMPAKSPAYDRQRRRHRGLGLAIVERFCRDHQGSLTVIPSDQGFIVQMHLVATQEGPVVL
jgi:signal transduction histidine kinase